MPNAFCGEWREDDVGAFRRTMGRNASSGEVEGSDLPLNGVCLVVVVVVVRCCCRQTTRGCLCCWEKCIVILLVVTESRFISWMDFVWRSFLDYGSINGKIDRRILQQLLIIRLLERYTDTS